MGGRKLYDPGYGTFLAAVGYILAMIGALSFIENANSPESLGTQEEQVNVGGDEE